MSSSIGQKKGFTQNQVKLIKRLLRLEKSQRDLCLFSVQIDTMLRSSDVLSLRVKDVIGFKGRIKEEFEVKQQKTKKVLTVQLQEDTGKVLLKYINDSGKEAEDYLFVASKGYRKKPLSLMGHSKLVNKWVEMIDLDPTEYGTHSLRRTKSAIIYEKTGNVEVVRQLLGQSNCTATSRYLGIGKREALDIGKGIVL